MLKTLNTLLRGQLAEAEDTLIDRNAVALLSQKIRDAGAGMNAAKLSLTGLIKRDRLEERQLEVIALRIADLEPRVRAALEAGDEAQATVGATALADLENEQAARNATRATLAARIARLRHSLSGATRRMADLRQAAATAKAVEQERRGQRAIRQTQTPGAHLAEAEALVIRILGQDDPFETDEIRAEIDASLGATNAAERLADAGYGPTSRKRPQDVLARLKKTN